MPVFLISSAAIRNGTVTITGALLDHLRASLRTQDGEEIWVGDERRRRYRVRVTCIDRRELQGEIVEEETGPQQASPAITLAQALLKGDRMDWAVQKAVELGAAAIVPLISTRVITRPKPDRLQTQQERWQRIALDASQQAERWEVPPISLPRAATDYFAGESPTALRLILTERIQADSLGSIPLPKKPEDWIALAVGPEGGWHPDEVRRARELGFTPITLGRRILRAETAAIAALSILQSRLGELG